MTKYLIIAGALIVLALVSLSGQSPSPEETTPTETPSQLASPSPTQFNEDEALAELKKMIAGKESEPAEEVFKNIETLKGVRAINVLAIMKIGYDKSLGVDCTYCHTPGQWEKDDVPHKQVARDMTLMLRDVNKKIKQIKNLESKDPGINCTTCHRGQTTPAMEMP